MGLAEPCLWLQPATVGFSRSWAFQEAGYRAPDPIWKRMTVVFVPFRGLIETGADERFKFWCISIIPVGLLTNLPLPRGSWQSLSSWFGALPGQGHAE